jgi:hypothetical protein
VGLMQDAAALAVYSFAGLVTVVALLTLCH